MADKRGEIEGRFKPGSETAARDIGELAQLEINAAFERSADMEHSERVARMLARGVDPCGNPTKARLMALSHFNKLADEGERRVFHAELNQRVDDLFASLRESGKIVAAPKL